MDENDDWLLGLLVMAHLYLDASNDEPPMSEDASDVRSEIDPRLLPMRVRAEDACPRDPAHRVELRADGAMWCRGCDEGFFPAGLIWGPIMSAAAA